MWSGYGGTVTLEGLADAALMSKYYFSRVFRSATQTSPFRFLTAIRLFEAKRLLRDTQLSVTDIALRVGYNSLGSFTSRFTESIGIPPGRYRSRTCAGLPPAPSPVQIRPGVAAEHLAAVRGRIRMPPTETPVRVYVGAFPDAVMEGHPRSWAVAPFPEAYELSDLTQGMWHVLAVAVPADEDARPPVHTPLFVGGRPVRVMSGQQTELDLALARPGPFDVPILLPLPELDRQRSGLRCLAAGVVAGSF